MFKLIYYVSLKSYSTNVGLDTVNSLVYYEGRTKLEVRKMIYTIKLYTRQGHWMAKWDNPNIIELMGGDTIVTGFMDGMAAADVLAKISKLNPEYTVKLI